jgi:hypothetical protein
MWTCIKDSEFALREDTMGKTEWAAVGLAALFLVAFLLYMFVLRDTWEEDNMYTVFSAKDEADSLASDGDYAAAIKKYEGLMDLVGDRRLNDPALSDVLTAARDALGECKRLDEARIAKEKKEAERIRAQQVEERRRQVEAIALAERARREEEMRKWQEAEERRKAEEARLAEAKKREAKRERQRLEAKRLATLDKLLEGVRDGTKRADSAKRKAKVGGGELTVRRWPSTGVLWLPRKGTYWSRVEFSASYSVGENDQEETNGFFKVSGVPQKLTSKSGDERVLKERGRDGSTFSYVPKEIGQTNVTVALAGVKVSMPVIVVEVPVVEGMSRAEVIKKLGMPDYRTSVFVSWEHLKKNMALAPFPFHGIDYAKMSIRDESLISREHWGFKKFPGAVVVVEDRDDGKVLGVTSSSPNAKWPSHVTTIRLRKY